jgi:hypothetical protein
MSEETKLSESDLQRIISGVADEIEKRQKREQIISLLQDLNPKERSMVTGMMQAIMMVSTAGTKGGNGDE